MIIVEIWQSFRRLPVWVQIWMAVILVPVNIAALAFVDQPGGALVALLAVGGMVPNIFIMLREGGLSKAMAFPHLFVWTPLVALIAMMLARPDGPEAGFRAFLWLLLAIDAISLGFDYPDAWRWWKGERRVA